MQRSQWSVFSFVLGSALIILQGAAARDLPLRSRDGLLIGYSEEGRSGDEGAAGSKIILTTEFASIKIIPYTKASPTNSKLVLDLASSGKCAGCNFYRHEHVPADWGKNGFYGPPYALLQGSLQDVTADPAFENAVPIRPGHVCFIPKCREFFIATAAHTEWGTSHSVWGEVDQESLQMIEKVPFEPSFTRTDNSKPPIVTTWLNNSIHFDIRLDKSSQEQQ